MNRIHKIRNVFNQRFLILAILFILFEYNSAPSVTLW